MTPVGLAARVRGRVLRKMWLPTTRFRRRRMQSFLETFAPDSSTRILDVGGTAVNWKLIGYQGDVVLLNVRIPVEVEPLPPNLRYVEGDGTQLPYPDASFDIVFSNSVIEHLHTYERQLLFGQELSRVADGLWVQTPARSFPIEPHFLAPFVHYLPRALRRRLVRNFTPYGWIVRPTQEEVDSMLDEYRLMTFRELQSAFRDCDIRRERACGLTKSYVAVRRRRRSRGVGKPVEQASQIG